MDDIEIFQVEDGYGYRVGGVYQPYPPDKDGFSPMTYDEAVELAEIVRSRMAT